MRVRFSIRDLLWLAVVAALVVGWWIDHRKAAEEAASHASSQLETMEMRRALMAPRSASDEGIALVAAARQCAEKRWHAHHAPTAECGNDAKRCR